jgi:hypothetical protein
MSTDKRVGLVPGLDAFEGVDGDEATELAGIEDTLHLGIEGCVAEDVADNDAASEATGGGGDGLGILEGRGDGLLEQEIVAELHRADGMVAVEGILGANDADIAELAGGEESVGTIESAEGMGGAGLGRMTANDVDSRRYWISSGGDSVAIGHLGSDAGVGAGARARTAEDKGEHGEEGGGREN